MAIVFKLRYDTTDLDFQDGEDGFQLAKRGWLPNVAMAMAEGMPAAIRESIALIVEGSSNDNLAALLQSLALYQRYGITYQQDILWDTPVWLHAKMSSETGEVRALVKAMDWGWDSSPYSGVPTSQSTINLNLSVLRMPYWERTEARSFPTLTLATGGSATYNYTAVSGSVAAHDIVGDAPARITALSSVVATGGPIARYWIGVRSAEKHGTLSQFENEWECELGTNETGAVDTVDATASDGYKVVFTPSASDTWEKVLTLRQGNAVTFVADNLGRFLWLLRYTNNATDWDLQLRFGYSGLDDDEYIYGPVVSVADSGAVWEVVEMGQSAVPLRNMQAGADAVPSHYAFNFSIQIWARRTDGSSTISFDCFMPIPIDEGYLMIRGADVSADTLVYSETPNGKTMCVQFLTASPWGVTEFVDYDTYNFRLPPGDGRLVIVAARSASHVLADTTTWGGGATKEGYFERWASLRGAE
jgi:hypothetical protein